MRRRTLLKGAAALPLLALASPLPAAKRPGRTPLRRVRPSDPGWPSASAWRKLDEAVGGNLLAVQSLFAPCGKEPGGAACREVVANIRSPFYIGDQPAGTQVSGWLDAWTPAPSVYAVRAQSSAAVAAAVDFARDNKLRLVVKGGGHSYQGTSNAPDSLLVWTRAMNEVELHEAFIPAGCAGSVAPAAAVSCGAGAMWIDLYHAVTEGSGRYVQGGGCTSVGVAGLVQSGGFGNFSKRFGTAAAGLLEAEVVTADGRVRTVNACSDPDLFWALKGGGGGSFGVVTRLTLRTHELPEFFGAAWGKVRANSDDAFRKLLARLVDFYATDLLNEHWGEAVNIQTGNTVELSMVCQGLDREQAPRVWQPFFEWISSAPADFTVTEKLGARATRARHWWDVEGNPSMIPDRRPGAPAWHGWWDGDQGQVGAFIHAYDSLWLPASLLERNQRRRLADALFAGSRYQQIRLHFNKGLAGAPAAAIAAARGTATNPGVTEAFALAIIADGERSSYPGMERPPMDLGAARHDAQATGLATAELRRLAPDAGSYVSESNYFNARWQQAFWGPNYPRLRSVKDRYDPDGLFFVHHGVGSEDWSPDGFTRTA
ncbi:MAG TPA: FAD-binding oxidoreductase [Steroidobacteraceae bacterium]|jgi:FAD/FMN-containing dehydrogenase|nr:FAD-binding oxidoreductase [Steroidobacteraceae bacterium]